MKKLVNILTCLVFVFLLTGVSFAKSENTERTAQANICISFFDQCSDAKAAAKTVVYQALIQCGISGPASSECTTANDNADRSKANAEYICDDGPRTVSPLEAFNLSEEKEITEKLKVVDSKLSFKDTSVK